MSLLLLTQFRIIMFVRLQPTSFWCLSVKMAKRWYNEVSWSSKQSTRGQEVEKRRSEAKLKPD